jgi:hypothetical protein
MTREAIKGLLFCAWKKITYSNLAAMFVGAASLLVEESEV